MSYVLRLGYDIEYAVLQVLEDIRLSVRTVEVYIALFFINKCFVAFLAEKIPSAHKVLNHADV